MARTDPLRDRPSGVATLLRAVAYSAEAIAAFAVPADLTGVSSLLLLGHVVTGTVLAVDLWNRRVVRRSNDVGFITVVLIVIAAIELTAFVVARREAESGQALWFAAALGFAVVGVLASWCEGGSDGAIASQLFFHGVALIPAVGVAFWLVFSGPANPDATEALLRAGPIARRIFVVAGIALPPLFVSLLAVLAHERSRGVERFPSPVWTALMVHEATYVVLAARWIYDGV
jgi:hypothetical protein